MVQKMKTFCCGCTLQTGAIVIGVLSAVSAVMDATNSLGNHEFYEHMMSISNFWLVLVVKLTLDVAGLVTSVVMIRGASNGIARHLRPWFFLHLVLLSVFVLHGLIRFFYGVSNDAVAEAFVDFGLRIVLASIFGFGLYTVHCYHQQLVGSTGNLEKVLEATEPPQIFVTSEKQDFKFQRL